MKPIMSYDEFLNEQEKIDEGIGLFDAIKRKRALGKVSAAAQELYDAIVKKYDIDIESSAYKESKEWYDLSREARGKKSKAYEQRLHAAQELVSELTDKCNNLLSQRSDDDKFRQKALAMINDAKSRARRDVMDKAEKEISKKSAAELRTEFDDWADEEFGIFGRRRPTKRPNKTNDVKTSDDNKDVHVDVNAEGDSETDSVKPLDSPTKTKKFIFGGKEHEKPKEFAEMKKGDILYFWIANEKMTEINVFRAFKINKVGVILKQFIIFLVQGQKDPLKVNFADANKGVSFTSFESEKCAFSTYNMTVDEMLELMKKDK